MSPRRCCTSQNAHTAESRKAHKVDEYLGQWGYKYFFSIKFLRWIHSLTGGHAATDKDDEEEWVKPISRSRNAYAQDDEDDALALMDEDPTAAVGYDLDTSGWERLMSEMGEMQEVTAGSWV